MRFVRSLALVLGLAASLPAAALPDCSGVSNLSGAKVLLDDFIRAGQAGETSAGSLQFAVVAIDAALRGALTGLPSPVTVLACRDRRPQGEGDFGRGAVSELDGFEVLVEVFGAVRDWRPPGGAPRTEATLRYVIIPVRRRDAGAPLSVVLASTRTIPVKRSKDMLAELFAGSAELAGYALVALAERALILPDGPDYDLARSRFCASRRSLARGASPPDVLAYLDRRAADTARAALADQRYRGKLRLLDAPPASCGGAP